MEIHNDVSHAFKGGVPAHAPRDEVNKYGMNLIERIADMIDQSRLAEFTLGMEQVLKHLGTNPDVLKNELSKDRLVGGLVHQPAQG